MKIVDYQIAAVIWVFQSLKIFARGGLTATTSFYFLVNTDWDKGGPGET